MMKDQLERETLINCGDEEDVDDRRRPNRGIYVCHICCRMLLPIVCLFRMLNIMGVCIGDSVNDCCRTCFCECLRGCCNALRSSTCRGLRRLCQCPRDCYKVCVDTVVTIRIPI